MNKLNKIMLCSAALMLCSTASASNTIDFKGEVAPETCTVKIDGKDGGLIVLPTVSLKAFQVGTPPAISVGKTVERKEFNVQLSDCPTQTSARTLKTRFVPNGGVSSRGHLGNLAPANKAEGVEIQLVAPNGTPINFAPTGEYVGNDLIIAANETTASATYGVEYVATATSVTTGSISSSLQYAIKYN